MQRTSRIVCSWDHGDGRAEERLKSQAPTAPVCRNRAPLTLDFRWQAMLYQKTVQMGCIVADSRSL